MSPENQQEEKQTTGSDLTSTDNPKNPFREDAPPPPQDPEADAAAEQQRKEALTERD